MKSYLSKALIALLTLPEMFSIHARRPALIGHRGASAQYPENTLDAFRAALEFENVDGFELDVSRSSDGVYFVLHDETLRRTAKINDIDAALLDTPTAGLTWEQIKSVELPDFPAPLVSECIELAKEYRKSIVIEFKIEDPNIDKVQYIEGFIQAHQNILEAKVDDWNAEEYVVFICFDLDTIKILKEKLPKFKMLFLIWDVDNEYDATSILPILDAVKAANLDGVQTNLDVFENIENFSGLCRKRGLLTGVYVHFDPREDKPVRAVGDRSIDNHKLMLALDIDMFTSDLPADLVSESAGIWNRKEKHIDAGVPG